MPVALSQKRQPAIFTTIKSEGAILPMDLLRRVSNPQSAQLQGLTPEDYHHEGERLNEAINATWTRLLGLWHSFRSQQRHLAVYHSGLSETREWLLKLFKALDYGQIQPRQPIVVGERSSAISHGWEQLPIHLVSYKADLDKSMVNDRGERRQSPHSLVQELLNRSPEHPWGLVSNGLILRILRNNVSLTRQAYVEFDLQEMFEQEVYADFVLFWLLCHESRFEKCEKAPRGWLETWSKEAHQSGVQALDHLRESVTSAIKELGSGFLTHPANGQLRQKLSDGSLSALDYYTRLLRLVYRLLVLFVAEDRGILFEPAASQASKDLYNEYYSTAHLRALADCTLGTRHSDLYFGLQVVMTRLGQDGGCPELGLPALNGKLFQAEALSDLNICQLANYAFLAAIRHLGYMESGRVRRVIDYKNLGSEELGSVYESLLELHPVFHLDSGTFELSTAAGNARKTTGSYYTPTSLITCLLDSALDPVLEEAADKPSSAEAEVAILNLKVCDPACGSGHFLVAAAHRIAKKLAAVRTGDAEPSPAERRRALREVVGRCIYGVDLNPMAVEICKVSLWMEAIDPGKPLSFLDAHIQQGNSLLGVTPALLKAGIPDEAFEALEGDDRKICSEFKKINKQQREGQLTLFREDQNLPIWEQQGVLVHSMLQLDAMGDERVADVRNKDEYYKKLRASDGYMDALLWANAWCAAFTWKKTAEMRPPITDEEFRDLGTNPFTLAPWRKAEIDRLAEQYQFFHWHLAFPDVFRVPDEGIEAENKQAGWSGGFDVVLGNPPWERIKIQGKEWFATRNEEIANAANAAARKRLIEQLQTTDSTLSTAFREALRAAEGGSAFVRRSGRYPLCGRGDVNTYSIFAENMRGVISPRGRVGCIVPSGIATEDTTKYFFQNLMDKQSLTSLYDFENREGIFSEVHRSYKFCLLTLTGQELSVTHSADFAFFALKVEDLQNEQSRFILRAGDIRLLNPNTRTCPIFRSRRDMLITKAIYERVPVLIKEGSVEENPWGITFSTMFHMSSDSHLFRTREQLEAEGWRLDGNAFRRQEEAYLPLYEGKMISHYDHRFNMYNATTDEFSGITEREHNDPGKLALPRYWVHEAEMPKVTQDDGKALLAFRDIARSTDVRTAIFGLVPVTAIGHTLPVALLDKNHHRDQIFLTASFSSFAFDFVTRQKLGGTHMTFFILKQLPVLPPSTYTIACPWSPTQTLGAWVAPRALELTYTAWDLAPFARDCGYNGPPFCWNEERRFLLRCELDAAYFRLYGVARDDVDYIMETFPIIRRENEKQCGDYRTKRVILEVYDEMQRAMENGKTYQTGLVPGPADPAVTHEKR
ncbi:MAG TPA: N-6 DNA methylase [Ktedonobacteraceae bacterium]|jgi:hypothetical protein